MIGVSGGLGGFHIRTHVGGTNELIQFPQTRGRCVCERVPVRVRDARWVVQDVPFDRVSEHRGAIQKFVTAKRPRRVLPDPPGTVLGI